MVDVFTERVKLGAHLNPRPATVAGTTGHVSVISEPVAARMSQVDEEIGYLNVVLQDLEGEVRELEDRLGKVLVESPPSEGQPQYSAAGRSLLSTAIRDCRTRAGVVRDTLRSITDRLEV